MSYYHIRKININKKNNEISFEAAASNITPIDYSLVNDNDVKTSFEDKYSNFIYNVISGNFHPLNGSNYSKLVMNRFLENYYNDASDIGKINTYNKYSKVINGILRDDFKNIFVISSDRELNPQNYYILKSADIKNEYGTNYFKNNIGELFLLDDKKVLKKCDNSNKNYGYPLYKASEYEMFKEYNDFLNIDEDNIMEL